MKYTLLFTLLIIFACSKSTDDSNVVPPGPNPNPEPDEVCWDCKLGTTNQVFECSTDQDEIAAFLAEYRGMGYTCKMR